LDRGHSGFFRREAILHAVIDQKALGGEPAKLPGRQQEGISSGFSHACLAGHERPPEIAREPQSFLYSLVPHRVVGKGVNFVARALHFSETGLHPIDPPISIGHAGAKGVLVKAGAIGKETCEVLRFRHPAHFEINPGRRVFATKKLGVGEAEKGRDLPEKRVVNEGAQDIEKYQRPGLRLHRLIMSMFTLH